jgi:hypothetical protein
MFGAVAVALHRPGDEVMRRLRLPEIEVVTAALPLSPEAMEDLSGEHGRKNREQGEEKTVRQGVSHLAVAIRCK